MPYQLSYDPKKDLITGVVLGVFDATLVSDYIRELAALAREKHCARAITDMRTAKPQMTVLEIDDLPGLAAEIGLDFSVRRALVVADDFEDYAFYQSSSTIRGQNVRIFKDIDAAKAWLFEKEADEQ
jgi:hypothetical protein